MKTLTVQYFVAGRIWLCLVVGIGGAAAQVGSLQGGTALVDGQVVDRDSLAPIAGARVRCGNSSAVTNANGAFQMTAGSLDGCRPALEAPTHYQGAETSIALGQKASGDRGTLILYMVRYGLMAGRVETRDRLPVAGTKVYVLAATINTAKRRLQMVDSALTQADGRYRFSNLREGTYYLFASPPRAVTGAVSEQITLGEAFYPEEPAPESAVAIPVKAATQQLDLVILLRPVQRHRISGQILGFEKGEDITRSVSLRLDRRLRANTSAVVVDPVRAALPPCFDRIALTANGQFVIEGVAPGEYDLWFQWRGTYGRSLAAAIDMPNRDLVDWKVEYRAPMRIEGKLVRPGESVKGSGEWGSLPKLISMRQADSLGEAAFQAPINESGDFTIPKLPPGAYEVYLFGGSPGGASYRLESISLNGVELSGMRFEAVGPGTGRLEVRVKEGRAMVQMLAPAEAGRTVLFPVPLRELDLLRGAVTLGVRKGGAMFQHANVLPGQYYGCALERLDNINLQEWVNSAENSAKLDKFCRRVQVKGDDEMQVSLDQMLRP